MRKERDIEGLIYLSFPLDFAPDLVCLCVIFVEKKKETRGGRERKIRERKGREREKREGLEKEGEQLPKEKKIKE